LAAKPPDRKLARYCVIINQCATPGLGSFIGGRRLAGLGQLALAVAGFGLVVAWFVLNTMQVFNQVVHDAPPRPVGRVGLLGAATFAAAWLWSWLTSLQILRAAKDAEPQNVPPRLT